LFKYCFVSLSKHIKQSISLNWSSENINWRMSTVHNVDMLMAPWQNDPCKSKHRTTQNTQNIPTQQTKFTNVAISFLFQSDVINPRKTSICNATFYCMTTDIIICCGQIHLRKKKIIWANNLKHCCYQLYYCYRTS